MPSTIDEAIESCVKLIGEQMIAEGNSRQIKVPLVTVLLGDASKAKKNTVLTCLRRQFGETVTKIPLLCTDGLQGANYAEVLTNYLDTVCTEEDLFSDKTKAWIGYFIDLMDDRYETFLQALADGVKSPFGTTVHEVVFLYCRQRMEADRVTTRKRLETFKEWYCEREMQRRCSFILLSDITSDSGPMSARQVEDTYRLGADLLALLTAKHDITENWTNNLCSYLSSGLWTAAYYRISKDTVSIACACMAGLLRLYGSSSGRAVGRGGQLIENYEDYFDVVLRDTCVPTCPENTSFLDLLPQGEAYSHIQDLEKLTFHCYTQELLDRLEKDSIKQRFYIDLTRWVAFEEMRSLLTEEKTRLENYNLPSVPTAGRPLDKLKAYGRWRLHNELKELLKSVMAELAEQAPNLQTTLNILCKELSDKQSETNYDRYRRKVESLTGETFDALTGWFVPGNREELLNGAVGAMGELVRRCPDLFNKTLTEDMTFRTEHDGIAGITTCFDVDLKKRIALKANITSDGEIEIDLLNTDRLSARAIGHIPGHAFRTGQADCVERLRLFRLSELSIVRIE